jgi:hypothetical protein
MYVLGTRIQPDIRILLKCINTESNHYGVRFDCIKCGTE